MLAFAGERAFAPRVRTTLKQQALLPSLDQRRPSAPAGEVRRARVLLLSAAGVSGVDIAARLDLCAGVGVADSAPVIVQKRAVDGRSCHCATTRGPSAGRLGGAPCACFGRHGVGGEDRAARAVAGPPAGRSRWTSRLPGKTLRSGDTTSGRELCLRCSLRPNVAFAKPASPTNTVTGPAPRDLAAKVTELPLGDDRRLARITRARAGSTRSHARSGIGTHPAARLCPVHSATGTAVRQRATIGRHGIVESSSRPCSESSSRRDQR